jgi:hypothetical protein
MEEEEEDEEEKKNNKIKISYNICQHDLAL